MEENTTNKLLIVIHDHDPVLARVVRAKMSKIDGWEIKLYENHAEALSYINGRYELDLVLTEIYYNDIDDPTGFEFIKAVRKLNPGVPIWVLTNFTQPEFHKRAEAAGATKFIIKSETSITDLISEIQESRK